MTMRLAAFAERVDFSRYGLASVRRRVGSSVGAASARVQSPLRRFGLQQRIALFVGSIVVALFAAFAYLGWQAVSRSTQEALTQRAATAGILAIHVDDLLEDAQDHLVGVSAEIAAFGPDLRADAADLALDGSQVHMHDYFSEVLVLNADNGLVSSRPRLASYAASKELRSLTDEAQRTKATATSNVVHLPVSEAIGVMFAAPIVADQQVVGFTVGEMQLPHRAFAEIGSTDQIGDSGQVELVDGNGSLLTSSSGGAPGSDAAHVNFYRPYLDHHADGLQTGREGGVDPFVITVAPVQRAPWAIGIAQSESEMFAATQRLRDQTAAAAAIGLTLTLCLAWIGTQSVVAPILALQRAGERMATGDLSEPIRSDHPDELGSLARVLETMRQRLRTSLAETQALNRSLEQRVRGRTQALQTSNEALEASNRRLRALTAVATAANAGGDLRQVLETSLRELVETAGGRGAWALVNEPEGGLRLAASHGLPMPSGDGLPLLIGEPPACLMALDGACFPCGDGHQCPVLAPQSTWLEPGTRCWSTPFRSGPQAFGILCLAQSGDRPLDADTSALMDGIAQQVASAFQAARLMEERSHLEAERRLDMLRGELLASVSHELRTPLGFIKGYAGTLLRDDVVWDESQQRSFLEIIDHESDQLTNLVESLLEAARVQAGRLQLSYASVDPEQVVRRAVDRISASLTRHVIQVEAAPMSPISADGPRLEQVALNLLQNAAKYSPGGGPIDVHLESDPDQVRLDVLDRGLGISAADAHRIFEPFYRAQSGDPTIGGAGLGLAVCRSIVEAHGGRIWAKPRDGGGTAVHVVLPRAEAAAA